MAILLFFGIYIIIFRKTKSVSLLLSALILFSSLASLLIAKNPTINNFTDFTNLIFTILILFIFVHSFKNVGKLNQIIENNNQQRFNILLTILKYVGLVVLCLNIYIVYKAFGLITSNEITIQSYKNEGGAADFLNTWVNHGLLTFSHFISPTGYLALALHFYFLSKSDFKKSLLFLIISFNIPLHGLIGLSRSATVQYILLYLLYLFYTYPSINKEYRKKIKITISLLFSILLVLLAILTTTRFTYSNVPQQSIIQNSILYSLFDYFSQWNRNGIEVMSLYSPEKLMYGRSSAPMLQELVKRSGFHIIDSRQIWQHSLGNYASSFNGLVASLLYDFGYIFSFIFSLLYYFLVRRLSPQKGAVSIAHYIFSTLLIPIPLMFFGNNQLAELMYSIAIVYALIFIFFLKAKI